MANFLYNGVELPDINEVWTDELKQQYPYAIIHITTKGTYRIELQTAMLVYFVDGEELYAKSYTDTRQFDLIDGVWIWQRDSFYTANSGTSRNILWSSYDIANWSEDDGDLDVYFPASEPIPVGGSAPIPEYMLYNGVELPNIDKVWTDKETYPHAFIKYLPSYSVYSVYLCKTPVFYNRREDTIIGTADTHYNIFYTIYDVNEENDGFVLYEQDGSAVGLNTSGIIWTSHDIVYSDNADSVYFAGSDPVPVGGGDNEPNTVDFTITYQSAYGSATESKTVTVNEGESYVLTDDDLIALEAEGYLFCGWSVNGEIISAGYAITADLVLVAVWESDVPEVLKQLVRAYKAGFAAAKALYGRW